MNSEYLKKYYYYERNHWWFQVREKIIKQQLNASLPSRRQLKILNAGAATGKSSQMLQQYGEVISVEKDHDTCTFLREHLKLHVIESDAASLPFGDDYFDVICIFDVIEHIEMEEQFVAELYRVCKPGGFLYCTVPAFMFLWSSHDEINHHKRRYTQKSIKQVLEYRFVVEYSTFFNMLLFFPIWFLRTILQRGQSSVKMVSDFERSRLLNSRFFSLLFKTFFSVELLLLRFSPLPFGVSILARARKPSLLS